jgi:hypothetical protein
MQPLPPHGLSRRHALQAGAIGLLGLGTNHLSALRALGGDAALRSPSGALWCTFSSPGDSPSTKVST